MRRKLIWLQLLIGWLPLWALLAVLIHTAHHSTLMGAGHIAFRMVIAAAALGFFVARFAERYPWPVRVTPVFVSVHLFAAGLYTIAWNLLNSTIESAVQGRFVIVVGAGIASSIMLGLWLYVMIAGVSYTHLATERAAKAEASAVQAQLAALRSQINPHFLFNALHTVVQLIPREPKLAAEAAEKLAGLLRIAIEQDEDVVTAREELDFVLKYLDIERLRFGDRLTTAIHLPDGAVRDATLPSFAVQTLVENAVRHGAAPRVQPSALTIRFEMPKDALEVSVHNPTADSSATATPQNDRNGTGLKRLRERLDVLYAGRATLETHFDATGFTATLSIPQDADD